MTPRVSVVIPVYNEGENIVRCLDRILREVLLPAEILVVHDMPEDTTVPYAQEIARTDPRVRPVLNTLGRGPANAIRFGIAAARAPVAVVTMADGCDDPRQIDDLARLVDRGVVVAAASRYMPGGQQVGGPRFKRMLSRWAGRTLHWFARVGTRDATNSFKAYDTDFVREVGIESPDRLRDRPGADGQGDPPAPPGRRDPDHLARPPTRRVPVRSGSIHAWVSPLVPLRVWSPLDVRAARRPSTRRGAGAAQRRRRDVG